MGIHKSLHYTPLRGVIHVKYVVYGLVSQWGVIAGFCGIKSVCLSQQLSARNSQFVRSRPLSALKRNKYVGIGEKLASVYFKLFCIGQLFAHTHNWSCMTGNGHQQTYYAYTVVYFAAVQSQILDQCRCCARVCVII